MRALFVAILLSVVFGKESHGSTKFGYRLDYATAKLRASEIDNNFNDYSSGHSSAFILRWSLYDPVFLEIGPGAWNSESGTDQFTFQYNSVGLGATIGNKIVFLAGAHLGAGLFAITHGAGALGSVQTSGTILREDALFSMLNAGVGYDFGKTQLELEVRKFAVFSDKFSKLNSITAGICLVFDLK